MAAPIPMNRMLAESHSDTYPPSYPIWTCRFYAKSGASMARECVDCPIHRGACQKGARFSTRPGYPAVFAAGSLIVADGDRVKNEHRRQDRRRYQPASRLTRAALI